MYKVQDNKKYKVYMTASAIYRSNESIFATKSKKLTNLEL